MRSSSAPATPSDDAPAPRQPFSAPVVATQSPLSPDRVRALGDELYEALRSRRCLPPLTERHPELDLDTAYRISLRFLESRKSRDGERVVGKKIGVTSKAVQEMLGVFQPDFGFLTDAMTRANGATIALSELIQPRIEAEIAFELEKDLVGPGVQPQQVLEATRSVYPCFEVVDSRIDDWRIQICDTVADNASCGVYAVGTPALDPNRLDLPGLHVAVYRNGERLHTGEGSAVQGDPLAAVAWLANTLGAYQIPFLAGEIILSGSLIPLVPVNSGDSFRVDLYARAPSDYGKERAIGSATLDFA